MIAITVNSVLKNYFILVYPYSAIKFADKTCSLAANKPRDKS